MDLAGITVTEISNMVTVYSEKGIDKTVKRRHYGLSFCYEGQITYIQNGKEYVSCTRTAPIALKETKPGASLSLTLSALIFCAIPSR